VVFAVISGLDLSALPREDGPPTELQARREKFSYFERHCSEVAQGLFLGSDAVAKSREILQDARITHVINCVGFLYPCYFKDELTYKVLFLQGWYDGFDASDKSSDCSVRGLGA
jgi:hypothetical protein